jgi:Bifunctional DNA primase/polymerase, N-terminal/Virulence-associated protein E/Primase C terminal 2 (PriCT-2)
VTEAAKRNPDHLILAVALSYAEQGLPVFPCNNKPGDPKQHKKPLTKHGFKDATTDIGVIRRWWKRWPNALVGMPTGSTTGIAVLDLDRKNGKDGFAAVPDWEQRSPVIARTINGGVHLYFRADGAPHCTSDEIALGVDTRGEGGYVIVPPSPGYKWINDGCDLSQLPLWPDDLRPPARSRERTSGIEPQTDVASVALALTVIPNDDLGWDEWNRIGMATWCATGGSDDGLAAFMAWSSKSGKHKADVTAERWRHYSTSPPTEIGAGTLFHRANEADPNWRTRAVVEIRFPDVTKRGKPSATLPNTKLALIKLGIECRYDLFKLRYMLGGNQIETYVGEVSDPALLRVRELIYQQFGFDPRTEVVYTAVQTLANHKRFHPVRDYLDGLSWDGVPRIDDWLTTYGGAEPSDFVRAVGALVLMAAVRRVREPGCKFDEIPVLENPEQGNNRSSALQLLAVDREWFSDNLPLGLSAKRPSKRYRDIGS